jgi:hypothetical protein
MRVDVQKSDLRRPECRTSKLCIAKSISIEAKGVDRAIAHGRRLELPQEIWACRRGNTTGGVERQPERRAEVSRGRNSRAGDEGPNELER